VLDGLREESDKLLLLWQHGKDFLSSIDEFHQFSIRMSLVLPDVQGVPVVLSGNVPFQEVLEHMVTPSALPPLQGIHPCSDARRPHALPLPSLDAALVAKAASTPIASNYLWPWDAPSRHAHFHDTLQAATVDLRTFNYRLRHTRQLQHDLEAAANNAAIAAGTGGEVSETAPKAECPICLQDIFRAALCLLPCTHKLCRQCTQTALKMHAGRYKCPLCKAPFTQAQVTNIDASKMSAATPRKAATSAGISGVATNSSPTDAEGEDHETALLGDHGPSEGARQQHAPCVVLSQGAWRSLPPHEVPADSCLTGSSSRMQLMGNTDFLRGCVVGSSALGGKLSSIVYFLQELTSTAAASGSHCRVLVFSQWDVLLRIVHSGLSNNGVPNMRVSGAADLPRTLATWQASAEHPVLLLPTRVGNSGLNITEANHIVFIEPLMAGSVEAQAIGRVHRGGQRRTTFVHRFVTEDTVEPAVAAAASVGQRAGPGTAAALRSGLTRSQVLHVLAGAGAGHR
jgi:DNA repair protein RAD5